MEKQVVFRETDDILDVNHVELGDVLVALQNLIERHGSHSLLRLEQGRYSDHYSAFVYTRDLETDEEFNQRVRLARSYEEREKSEYERLKAKFG